jgi:hypothetical protein
MSVLLMALNRIDGVLDGAVLLRRRGRRRRSRMSVLLMALNRIDGVLDGAASD